LLIVIFILPAPNLCASPVASPGRTERYVRAGTLQRSDRWWAVNCAKSDADFGGQRYVKQAEFGGLSEG